MLAVQIHTHQAATASWGERHCTSAAQFCPCGWAAGDEGAAGIFFGDLGPDLQTLCAAKKGLQPTPPPTPAPATHSTFDQALFALFPAAEREASTMADSRQSLLFSAKISEQAERYQDMVAEMKKIAEMAGEAELSVEERNLLSVGQYPAEADGASRESAPCLPAGPHAASHASGVRTGRDPGLTCTPSPLPAPLLLSQATRTSWAPGVPPGAFCRAWSRVRLPRATRSASS